MKSIKTLVNHTISNYNIINNNLGAIINNTGGTIVSISPGVFNDNGGTVIGNPPT